MRRNPRHSLRRAAKWAATGIAMAIVALAAVSIWFSFDVYYGRGDRSISVNVGNGLLGVRTQSPKSPAPSPLVGTGASGASSLRQGFTLHHERTAAGWIWAEPASFHRIVRLSHPLNPGTTSTHIIREFTVSFWFIIPFAAAPAFWLWWRDRQRRLPGQCIKCGYDRVGLGPSLPCPECGERGS